MTLETWKSGADLWKELKPHAWQLAQYAAQGAMARWRSREVWVEFVGLRTRTMCMRSEEELRC